ncbi:MAG TPA: DedA family protein, partial [Candidatus Hydrogenedentes bacterium]|nr:DedA family protein [Candidatus Hydrogenedentota bacterium]
MKIIRRLYDWVLHWADTPYGMTALVLIAFAESSFFPIPPDVLLIALCLGRREKWARFASACAVASVAGGIAGYAIGWGVWQAVDQFFFAYVPGFSEQAFERVSQLYD